MGSRKNLYACAARMVGLLAVSFLMGGLMVMGGCAVFSRLPEDRPVAARIDDFPVDGLRLEAPATLSWSDHLVPFIEAQSDHDFALLLGAVQAHLRLGQMELLRRISAGRLSEIAGPLLTDIDHALRILDPGRAAPAVLERMTPQTRAFLRAFVEGINHIVDQMDEPPHEFRIFNLKREIWTELDVLRVGRLAAIDVNWLRWFRSLGARDRPDWPALWARMVREGEGSVASFADSGAGLELLSALLLGSGKVGSNAFAVGGDVTASGAGLLANDPHLGLTLPNTWLLAGGHSPSYDVTGLMIPGLPFFAIGRNRSIAWGGTNMRALSSDLVSLAGLPDGQITERQTIIKRRWWFPIVRKLRDSPYGPVISDASILPGRRDGPGFALRWMGHRGSDEIGAMLAVSRARDFPSFREALAGFGVSGQNMLYADKAGHVGQVMAVHLPRSNPGWRPADIVVGPDERDWTEPVLDSSTLPAIIDPPSSFIASANNRPAPAQTVTGLFFSHNDRIKRLHTLLARKGPFGFARARRIQLDVRQGSSVALRDRILVLAGAVDALSGPAKAGAKLLREWDGRYDTSSIGASAFERYVAAIIDILAPDDAEKERILMGGDTYDRLGSELAARALSEPDKVSSLLREALYRLGREADDLEDWGSTHRLRLGHPILSRIPLLGGWRYVFADIPGAGSNNTLNKSAHSERVSRHTSSYGANARFIADLGDPDLNWAVLFGGQDGWLSSPALTDQVEMWRFGKYLQLPLSKEGRARIYRHRIELLPSEG